MVKNLALLFVLTALVPLSAGASIVFVVPKWLGSNMFCTSVVSPKFAEQISPSPFSKRGFLSRSITLPL